MGYVSLESCVLDLEEQGLLVRIREPLDPHLEIAEVQRRAFARGGPALLFEKPKGTQFPMLGNLFGTKKRAEYIFRDALPFVSALVSAKTDPAALFRRLNELTKLPSAALSLLPTRAWGKAPVLAHQTTLSALPKLVSWPDDGGPFITLPQVYTEDPDAAGVRASNLGMYRVQLAGNDYLPNREVGLHYQLHRGIGVHHKKAIDQGRPLRVNVFVGGPPAMTLAAVMPLPEGLPELSFAGAMNRRAVRMVRSGTGPLIHADADFCISGVIEGSETKREGPFGDHLGYYAKAHPFPVMRVLTVHHREGAIWPFTVVGRPPQEDTIFGELIHMLTGRLVPNVLPGVRAVHAVDAAGVHPLLLALGSERYVPYQNNSRPMELLTQANAILGSGQMSLAKYLVMTSDDNAPDIHDVSAFLGHVLERMDPTRDLHFHVNTTIDTLDYSGDGLNQGSKLVWLGVGPKRRELCRALPPLPALPDDFSDPRLAMPGVCVVRGSTWQNAERSGEQMNALCKYLESEAVARAIRGKNASSGGERTDSVGQIPLWVVVDDSDFAARSTNNFLWATFTRSNPAVDVAGAYASTQHKAWGCRGPIVIDARRKPHHAPPLIEDKAVTARIDALSVRGGPLFGLC
jgi:4-hydroxy-3-polyprenylbenzoate decarboxylase